LDIPGYALIVAATPAAIAAVAGAVYGVRRYRKRGKREV
jgi:hypothetical protein